MNKKEYYKYMQSKEWKEDRIKLYEKSNKKCKVCNFDFTKVENKGYVIHHINYSKGYKINKEFCKILCRRCHEEIHFTINELNFTQEQKEAIEYMIENPPICEKNLYDWDLIDGDNAGLIIDEN